MPYSRPQLFELSKKVGRSWRTLQYWASQGCDLNDPQSLERFIAEKNRKRTNVQKLRERRGLAQGVSADAQHRDSSVFERQGNGDSAAAGQRGAQHTLARLEQQEEESFRRLKSALQNGDRFEIDACQPYWLKVAETLRRLDLSIELARRDAEEQVTKRLACDVALAIADWLRISFAAFLSSEARPLMGIRDVGEWKHYAFERFRSILHLTVRNSLNTNSPIPGWATSKVVESWNIPTLDADGNQGTGSNCGLSTDCARTMAQDDKRRGFRKTYPLTIVPSRGALAEPQSGVTTPVRPEQQGASRLPIESKAQLCMGLIGSPQTLALGLRTWGGLRS